MTYKSAYKRQCCADTYTGKAFVFELAVVHEDGGVHVVFGDVKAEAGGHVELLQCCCLFFVFGQRIPGTMVIYQDLFLQISFSHIVAGRIFYRLKNK